MYLYRQKSKHHDLVRLFESQDEARLEAIGFVGDHNEADGCSSPASMVSRTVDGHFTFSVSRSTSFGQRTATVQSIGDQLVELL